jgi:hypothetical protein
MAKLKGNMIMFGATGGLGGGFYVKQLNGETIVCKMPRKRPGPGTPAQEVARQRMAEADLYAKHVLSDPATALPYLRKASAKYNAHNLAVRDFFRKPRVTGILMGEYSGSPGNKIVINTKDDFMVTRVWVSIYDGNDILLEEGWASSYLEGVRWNYFATKENASYKGSRIVAVAYDLPGNSTSLEAIV